MASLALELAEWGIQDPAGLEWIDTPPAPSLAEGRRLLQCLGAMDANGVITPHGKRMASLPVHPRLAHMLLVAHDRGEGCLASDLAALLSERDILRFDDNLVQRPVSCSDLLDRVEALSSWRKGGKVGEGGRLDPWLLRVIDRTSSELLKRLGSAGKGNETGYGNIGVYLAMAFPERIGRQREPGSDRYLLANGRGGRLSPRSAVRDQPFIVAVAMDAGERGDGLIHFASSISLEDLRREFGNRFRLCRKVEWDRREGRVAAMEEECLGELVVAARNIIPHGDELIGALLEGVRVTGLTALNWTPQASQLRERVAHAAHLFPKESWPDLSDNTLMLDLERWLAPHLEGVRSLSDLAKVDMLAALKGMLTWEELRRLDEGMPTHISVPSGSRVAITYSADGPPVLAVKLQELFGLAETPTVAWGREAVLLHLLSPAGRPIQVTGDLRNFWDKVYPEVKKELKGRYPKHPWPDDPWSAVPTRHVKKR
jgi:ATP-dependent helicase HrpB